jgi:hypothetical protein
VVARRHAFVRAILAIAVAVTAGACASPESASLPIAVTSDVQTVLDGWHAAGIACDAPTAGMPGPTLQWHCAKTYAGVELTILLTSDSRGLESIVADAPDETDPSEAGEAWSRLLEETRGMDDFTVEAARQLRATGARAGWYDVRWGDKIGHLSIVEYPGCLCVFIVPDGGRFEAQPNGNRVTAGPPGAVGSEHPGPRAVRLAEEFKCTDLRSSDRPRQPPHAACGREPGSRAQS